MYTYVYAFVYNIYMIPLSTHSFIHLSLDIWTIFIVWPCTKGCIEHWMNICLRITVFVSFK